MDWPASTEPLIVAFPRGRLRDGGAAAGGTVVKENPLRWTSLINERVLSAHGLYLRSTVVGPRDPTKPGCT